MRPFALLRSCLVLASVTLVSTSFAGAGSAQSSGPDALKAMIEQAKKEPDVINGRVTLALIPLVEKANKLFNEKFGLNKTIRIAKGVDNTFTTQMMAALDLGGTAELAFYATNGGDMPAFVGGNYALKIKDWEAILAEVNPRVKAGVVKPTDVSPAGYAGYAFAHSNRLKGVGYNKKLISEKDLPKTYAEMADPKYKGQFAIEPWTSHWLALGYVYYPNRLDELSKILGAIGKNTYVVSRSHQLIPRMSLGEFKFMTLNAEVVAEFVDQNPGAPLDYYFMKELTLVETTLVFAPRKGPAPATAALWAMFMSHPDVQALRGPNAPNVMYGELESDKKMKAALQGKNVWDWQMNESTTKYWKWVNSDDAKKFRQMVSNAIRQRK